MLPKKASVKRLCEDFIEYGVKEHAKKESRIENYYQPEFWHSMYDLMDGDRSYDPDPEIDYKDENYKIALESIGCKIESWEDISEFKKAFQEDFQILPEKESAKHLCVAFLDYHHKYTDEKIKNEIIRSTDWKQVWNSLVNDFKKTHPEWDRDDERRADLHTLRDPALARGLRDYLFRHITNCKANHKDCSVLEKDSPSHPSVTNRVTYLTQALCKNYPEENRDLCPDARLPRNATCPSSHRFIPI